VSPLRKTQIEAWTIEVVDRLKADQPVEYALVELKADWIPATKAARRLAAHANSAHGEPILWIIGLDEKRGVVGVEHSAFADWWAGVQAEFNDVVPAIQDLAVRLDGHTLVALVFETDRAPYLVRNPMRGQAGNVIDWEVPWRAGTATRSARRDELLRILVPWTRLPEYEVTDASVRLGRDDHADSTPPFPPALKWHVQVDLYFVPTAHETIVFPLHLLRLAVGWSDGEEEHEVPNVSLSPYRAFHNDTRKALVFSTPGEFVLNGPGRGILSGYFQTPFKEPRAEQPMRLEFAMTAVRSPRGITETLELQPRSMKDSINHWLWSLREPPEESPVHTGGWVGLPFPKVRKRAG
jgi:hypothetical protein